MSDYISVTRLTESGPFTMTLRHAVHCVTTKSLCVSFSVEPNLKTKVIYKVKKNGLYVWEGKKLEDAIHQYNSIIQSLP